MTPDAVEVPEVPKVLYTSADLDAQGGALRCLLDMGNEIGRWGFRPVLVLSDRQSASTGDGPRAVTTYRLPLPRPQRGRPVTAYVRDVVETLVNARRLAAIIRRERVAVVHVNEILDVYGGIAARIARVPCVWHVRADISSWPRPLTALLPWVVGGLSSEVLAVSDSVRTHVFAEHGVRDSKVSVLHDPGPDPATFRPGLDGSAIKRELDVEDEAPIVVLVAKMVEPKGHEVLLRAVPRIIRSFPRARVVVVGGDLEGAHHRAYAERIRRLPADLGVAHAVTFTGYRSDVARIMAAADVVTHCSTHPDPFPGVVLQGMALGKAVVASDIGGPREQIDPGRSGLLVPPADSDALAGAVCWLLGDPDLREALGRVAAREVRTRFAADRFYQRLASSYGRLIGAAS
jgi:glycosyltransferase involved in cell wall biosynthesis